METNNRLTTFIDEVFGSSKFFALVLALILLRFLFPGDTSFLHDEAMLLDMAMQGVEQGDWLINVGLQGTRGFKYGPFGPSFYLYLLYLTKNIYVLLFLKNLIISLMTAAGVALILKRVKIFDRTLWLFLFLSPTLYIYARMLWDNPFLISLTSLCVGGYVAYIHDRKFHFFALAVITACLGVLTHLMIAPLCVALFAHFAIFHFKDVKAKPLQFIVLFLVAAAMLYPYFSYVIANKTGGSLQESVTRVLWFPFLGLKFYSFIDFEYFYGKQWERLFFDSNFLYKLIRSTKVFWFAFYLMIPLGWYGIGETLWKSYKNKNYQTTTFHIAFLSAATLIVHLGLCLLSNLYKNPHYYNGVWMIHFFVLAFALIKLNKLGKWGERLKIGYLILMFLMNLGLIYINKTHQGARSRRYGANLNQQVKVAKELNRLGVTKEEITYKTFHLDLFDLAIDVLRKLDPAASIPQKSQESENPKAVKVDYIHPRHPFQKNGFSQIGASTP